MTDRRRSRRAVLATTGAVLSTLAGCVGFVQNDDGGTSDDDGREQTVTDTPGDGTDTPDARDGTPDETPTPLDGGNAGGNGDDTDTDRVVNNDSYVWRYQYGGSVDAVADGTVLMRHSFANEETDGGLVGLDAATGSRTWQYGMTDGLTSVYTDPTVADAVYLGQGDDQIGAGTGKLMAVEFDGTERWAVETGTIYQQPVVAGGAVYAGSDDGSVRAVDADTGTVRWATDDIPWEFTHQSTGPVAVDADDVVYVRASELVALDPDDGTTRWQYGNADSSGNYVRDLAVSGNVAYVAVTERGVSAIEAGEERWHTALTGHLQIRGVYDGSVLVAASTGEDQAAIHALDTETGTRQWSLEGLDGTLVPMAVESGRLYVDEGNLGAYRLDDGTPEWETAVDGDIGLLTVDDSAEPPIYLTDGTALVQISRTGDVVQSVEFSHIDSLVIGEAAFVGAESGIYRVDTR